MQLFCDVISASYPKFHEDSNKINRESLRCGSNELGRGRSLTCHPVRDSSDLGVQNECTVYRLVGIGEQWWSVWHIRRNTVVGTVK